MYSRVFYGSCRKRRFDDNKCEHPLFLPLFSSLFSFLPFSFSPLLSPFFCRTDDKRALEASARRLWRNDDEEDFFFLPIMVRVEDATNESDDGLFALMPEDIIVHRILAELDAISMLRFSLSSKTNSRESSAIIKMAQQTPTTASSRNVVVVVVVFDDDDGSQNKTSHVERETRRRTTNTPCVVGPSRDDDDDGRGLDCWWSSKTARRRTT